jgi:SNF2 family DNA or RNA helicase
MGLRNAHNWKRYEIADVDGWLEKHAPRVPMTYPMREHQKRSFCLGLINPKFYFQLDMGLGKSKLVLDLFLARIHSGAASRALVLVPASLNLPQWRDQVAEHAPSLSVALCTKGTEKFIHSVSEGTEEVCVMTYAAAVSVSKKEPEFFDNFDFLILDESSSFRSHDGVTFRALKPVCKKMRNVYLLSGTPFSKSAEGLWSQFYLLDQGDLLGWNISEFRRRFFIEKVSRWKTEWVLHPDREEMLFKVLHHLSVRYNADECLDLPPELHRTIEIQPSTEQVELFHELDAEKRELLDQGLTVGHLDNRLRLLSCGIDYKGGVSSWLMPNPKLNALLDLLDEIEQVMGEESIIVVHHSIAVAELLLPALKDKKIKAVAVNGTMSAKEKDKAVTAFTSGKARVLVANSTAAYGLNLQGNCRTMIFFEHHEDMLVRQQIKKRIQRIGQERKVYYYDLTLDLGKDEKALSTLTTRVNRLGRVVDGHKATATPRARRIKRET